jgi:hypothetical protein
VQVERHAILEHGAADGTRRVDRLNDAKQALAVGDIRALSGSMGPKAEAAARLVLIFVNKATY